MTKQQLRKQFTALRQQLTTEEYNSVNQQLLWQFQQLDLTDVHGLHLYLPAPGRKEPDTLLIRDWLREHHPHITLMLPKTDLEQFTMQSYADDKHLQLAVNSWGIIEPTTGTLVDNAAIDLIIVPLLAFDQRGYRVGYGKGFYDRFIALCRPDVRLVGLSFFEPVARVDDLHEFDIPIQECITPSRIWAFNH